MAPATAILPANRSRVRSLPIEQWPSADRDAWTVACRPSQRLIRGGAGAHMKPVTLSDLARRYGYFLDSLDRSGLCRRNACKPGEHYQDGEESKLQHVPSGEPRMAHLTAAFCKTETSPWDGLGGTGTTRPATYSDMSSVGDKGRLRR